MCAGVGVGVGLIGVPSSVLCLSGVERTQLNVSCRFGEHESAILRTRARGFQTQGVSPLRGNLKTPHADKDSIFQGLSLGQSFRRGCSAGAVKYGACSVVH